MPKALKKEQEKKKKNMERRSRCHVRKRDEIISRKAKLFFRIEFV